MKTTEKNLIQLDRDGMEDENVITRVEFILAEEIGAALNTFLKIAEGDQAMAVYDGDSI